MNEIDSLWEGVGSLSHADHLVEIQVAWRGKVIGMMGQVNQPYSYELELHGKRPQLYVARSLR
jgi:hypothetical protein